MRNYIVLFLGCLLFHLAGTWSLPLIDRDEPRFAEAAREMRERGDYIVPYFNNQFRFDKPPLTYWFQVASYRLFGENDFAARFPTAIAAALVALILFAWGQQVRDETRRLVGGNNFHPFAANIHPRKSGGGGHVAGVVRHAGALGGMGTAGGQTPNVRTSNIERSNGLLVDLLCFVGVGVSGEGADWMDAVVNGCDCAKICSSGRLCRAFQIRPRTLA